MTEKARAWGETVEKEVQDGGGGQTWKVKTKRA